MDRLYPSGACVMPSSLTFTRTPGGMKFMVGDIITHALQGQKLRRNITGRENFLLARERYCNLTAENLRWFLLNLNLFLRDIIQHMGKML